MFDFLKKKIYLIVSFIFFIIGIIFILKSDTWDFGSIPSMNLAGSIFSIFFGIIFIKNLDKN